MKNSKFLAKQKADIFDLSFPNYFSNLFGNTNDLFSFWKWITVSTLDQESTFPKINVIEDETQYKVEIAISGYKKEEISLCLKNNALCVGGKKFTKDTKEESNYIMNEISEESFEREIPFSIKINLDGISSTLKDGILTCFIKKNNERDKCCRKIKID